MKILHIASFSGNLGDLLSHQGLYNWIESSVNKSFEYEKLEIRHTYLNWDGFKSWTWEEDLAFKANESDLVLIGGGNYLEPWVEQSATGTTINIDEKTLAEIKTPIYILGVGLDYEQGTSVRCLTKLRTFIIAFLSQEKNHLYLRNDGSIEQALELDLPSEIFNRIGTMPDPAFGNNLNKYEFKKNDHTEILLNLASDINHSKNFDKRFSMSYQHFMGGLLEKIFEFKDLKCINLVAHTYDDLDMINKIIKESPQYILREHMNLGALSFDNRNIKNLIDIYSRSDVAFVTRFHSAIASIITNTPFVHINTHQRIANLLENLKLKDLSVKEEILEKPVMRNLVEKILLPEFQTNLRFIAEQEYEKGALLIRGIFAKFDIFSR